MAEYALTTPTAVALNGTIPFNATIVKGCCNIHHRNGSGIINIKGGSSCCNPNRYHVSFHANVTGVAGAIQLALFLDGEQLPETLMSVVPAAAADVWSVDSETEILSDCSCQTITARVVTGTPVTVNTANIVVTKEGQK